jgi:cytochrome b561
MTRFTHAAATRGQDRYGGVAKTLHWLIVVLVAVQLALGWTMPDLPRGRSPEGLVSLHLSVGATILIVMLARLAWRLVHGAPPSIVTSAWQRQIACATHAILYALLIVVPLAGWAWASSKAWPVTLFGVIDLPALVPTNWPYRPLAATVHRNGVWVIVALVGLHALAALHHHIVRRDGVLRRMLPGG